MLNSDSTVVIKRVFFQKILAIFFVFLSLPALAAPSVAITTPVTGASYLSTDTITITTAPITDPGTTVARVNIYRNGSGFSVLTMAPWSFDLKNTPLGTYTYTAVITDSTGATATSAPIVIKVNNPPTVSITSPQTKKFYYSPSTVTITADATDTDGTISKVEFFTKGNLIATATSSPYTIAWENPEVGEYSVTAKATDNNGATKTSGAITIRVGVPPTLSLIAPTAGAIYPVGTQLIMTSNASTANVGATITSVDYYEGTTYLNTLSVAPYGQSLNLGYAGTRTVSAKVTDSFGATFTTPPVSFRTNSLPKISITAPVTNTFYPSPANIALTSTASDTEGPISKVEYFSGNTLIGTSTVAPFTVNWANVPNGAYTITAKATDNDSMVNTSAAVAINVGVLPTVSITTPRIINTPGNTNLSLTTNPVTTNSGASIQSVGIFEDGKNLGLSTSPPWTVFVGTLAVGTHNLTARVVDTFLAVSTSDPTAFKVNNSPSVGITSPTNNSSYSGPASVLLTATASDTDGGISKVEFFNGTTLVGSVTAPPYAYTWTNVSPGNYSITAKATDSDGAITTSAAISFAVSGGTPSISINSPANNSVYSSPANLTLTTNPTTPTSGATVSKVEFFKGGTLFATVNAAPWTATLANQPVGTYVFTAKVTDSVSATATSSPLTIKVNALPTVAFTSPANNSSFVPPANITLTATASDSDGNIAKVDFYNGAALIGTAATSPYSIVWSGVSAGLYTITAKATDNDNMVQTSSPISLKVGAAPAISITSPATNVVFNVGTNFTLTTNPTTPNSGATITKVEIFKNGTLYGTSVAAPWTSAINGLPAGTHNFTATVTDSYGATATSAAVSVKVNAFPTINLSSPITGTFYAAPASISITAGVSDTDGTISKVEFFNGSTLLGTSSAAPYTFVWSNLAIGTYSITAKVTDNDGATATTPVSTAVVGTNPTVSITSPLNNAVMTAPAGFTLTANPATTNAGATISKVYFYRDTTFIGQLSAAPWSVAVNSLPVGTYSFTAQVVDSVGAQKTSAAAVVKVNALPSIAITTPAANTFYAVPATVNLVASANDSDGSISKVEFFNGSTLIGTTTSAPYSFTWSNVVAGTYTVTAKATDNDGGVKVSASVVVTAGTAPTVSITSPTNNTIYAAPATFSLTSNPATPNTGASISKVEFFKSGTLFATVSAAPWTASISNQIAGTYAFTAKVTDSIGASATSSPISVKVNALPVVNITAPATNSFYSAPATVSLTATATDADGTISKIEFFNGSTLIGTATTSPYTVSWANVAAGTYTVTAKATDANGGVTTSAPITIKSGAAPTVNLSVTQNGTGTAPPYNFNLTASPATTNPGGSITSVKFYKDGVLISSINAAPWSFAWNNVTTGTYNLTAQVTDNNNVSTTSASVTALVGNFPPVIYIDKPLATAPSTAKRASAFEYDPVTGLLTKEIIEPDQSDFCIVNIYSYDQFGNKNSVTTRNCNGAAGSNPGINTEASAPAVSSLANIVTRTTGTVYDSQGRFPISSTNALDQSESKLFDSKFGLPLSLTGPNNLTTTWTYDTFGLAKNESRADGTSSQTDYVLCDGSCPANAKYKVTATQTGKATSKTYFDMLGRAIRNEIEDRNGVFVFSNTEYDRLGHVLRTSRPVKGSQTLAWTTITYDSLDRPLTTTLPDSSVTKVSYNGKVTITTNALNQTKTEQINSQGKTVQIIDSQGKSISFLYDGFGNLIKTSDAANNIVTISYDISGRKTGMVDPDQGSWKYEYNVLDLLVKQTDALDQVTTFAYDKLGRLTQRNEPDLKSTWAYDNCDAVLNTDAKCIGKLVKETSDNGYVRTYVYDAKGRSIGELDNVDTTYGVSKAYDAYGRVASLVYPTGFSVINKYSTNGYLTEVRNASTNALYWKADTTDAVGNITQETYGNGIVTNRIFNDNTGLLTQINVGASGVISSQTFDYDTIGNLKQRYEGATGLNETFDYDSLNRLKSATAVSGSNTTSVTLTYDAIGNIITKSDVGTYKYGVKPHAVLQILMSDGVTQFANYNYNANGNNLSGYGRTITWTSWNMPISITKGANSFSFVYNSAHERVKEVTPDATIYNISPRLDTGIHVEKRIKKTDGSIEYIHYLYAGKMPFGRVVTNAASVIQTTQYFHTDHLGSIVAITDQAATLLGRRSYDAWGERRNINGTPITSLLTTPSERHGFTMHEELLEVGIIHMNGRIYDPAIGRFLSADPTIQYPDDLQNYNRYSYINNNPLSAVDYSGYGWLKKIGKAIAGAAKSVLKNKVIRTAISIYVGYQLGVNFLGTGSGIFGAGNAIANGAIGGFGSGLVSGEGNLKVALVGAFSGASFGFVGDLKLTGWDQTFAHGIAGGLSSVAGGGSFGSGFLSGGFAEYAGGKLPNMPNVGVLVARMAIGGTASVIGGGKFGNGAMTAAYGYLFNHLYHENTDSVGGMHQRLAVRGADGKLLYGASFGMTNGDDPDANPFLDNFSASGQRPAVGDNGNGKVYEDVNPVTTKVQKVFITTPAEDRVIIKYLQSVQGQTAPYNVCTNSCRTWSSSTYDYLVNKIEKLRLQQKTP